ncbi:MAG: SurA N-terminal domain-containing protein [Betaproteobacteria bacterium]|nr:SurA N-terminal domain-containing protein [Betaproteobacteria bacterium]
MFDLVHKHKRVAQIILALLIVPFAFVGVDYYFRRDASTAAVATVSGEEVSRAEFDDLVRQQQDRLRQQMGRAFDPAIFDNPEVRYSLVEQLVAQRVLQGQARGHRFRVADTEVARAIAEIEAFRVDGKFSKERYVALLAQQNMTPAMFERRLREELLLAPLQEPLAAANIVAAPTAERFLALLAQQREVAVATIDAEPFAKDAKVADADVKAFYDQNPAAFQTPEQAKVEYLLLTLPALEGKVTVDAAEVRKAYEERQATYAKAEERKASHILVASKPDMKDADREAAKAKAEKLAAQARANPAKFAELAKASSEDPGSAAQGGDLGAFARGSMVKPFEDAVFAAKEGDIVGPVATDFGWHVIMVTGIERARQRAFDEVKGEIEADVRRQKAQARFAAAADQLQNLVYEQADSLAPAAKALDMSVTTTPFVTRSQVQQLAMGNAKLVAALFAPESVQAKRNTEAIEVGTNALMAARIAEYKPAAPRPFDEVRDEIRRQLVARSAAEQAAKVGREALAKLEAGASEKEAGVTFGKAVSLQRNQPQPGFTAEAVTRVFQADAAKLPRYVGATSDKGGFAIYKLVEVKAPEAADPRRAEAAAAQLGDQIGRELTNAYVASLKAAADVKINQKALEAK